MGFHKNAIHKHVKGSSRQADTQKPLFGTDHIESFMLITKYGQLFLLTLI